MNRATFRYRSLRDPRTELRTRIREIAQVRVRYGYRKIRVLFKLVELNHAVYWQL
jgi:putative transposase